MTWQKKYRWSRTWGQETGLNGLPHEDYIAHDGEENIGRIYLDQQTLKAGKWRWVAYSPKGVPIVLPSGGWLPTAQEAAKQVEEYWDARKGEKCSGR